MTAKSAHYGHCPDSARLKDIPVATLFMDRNRHSATRLAILGEYLKVPKVIPVAVGERRRPFRLCVKGWKVTAARPVARLKLLTCAIAALE